MIIKPSDEVDTTLQEYVIHPVDWFKKYHGPSIPLKANQKIEVGIHIEAPPIYGMLQELELIQV